MESNKVKEVTVIQPTNNNLGMAAAYMSMSYSCESLEGKKIIAQNVKDDSVIGDYVAIVLEETDEEGARFVGNRMVAILPVPMDVNGNVKAGMKHIVRFTNYNRLEEQREFHFMNIRLLANAIIEYLLIGELADEEL